MNPFDFLVNADWKTILLGIGFLIALSMAYRYRGAYQHEKNEGSHDDVLRALIEIMGKSNDASIKSGERMERLIAALEKNNELEDERIDMRKSIAAKEHEIGEQHTIALRALTESASKIVPAIETTAGKEHQKTRELVVNHVTRTVQDSEGEIRKEFKPVTDRIDELVTEVKALVKHVERLVEQHQTASEATSGAVQGELNRVLEKVEEISTEFKALKSQFPNIKPTPVEQPRSVEFDPYKTESKPGGLPMSPDTPKPNDGEAR